MEGSVGHTDTAGNNRRVSAGGIQVMQTGSGISHQEEMYGERTEFFQIWFEPNMRKTLRQPPTYSDVHDSQFPRETLESGARVKRIVGPEGAARIEAPIEWNEISLEANGSYRATLDAQSLAAMVVTEGNVQLDIEGQSKALDRRDFAQAKADEKVSLTIKATNGPARFAIITAPLDPGYPLVQF
jgi:redox-sensitive bicupin YhaK (pirin superfamily)